MSETPVLYTMQSRAPTGNHGFPFLSEDLGAHTKKLLVFDWKLVNLKGDSQVRWRKYVVNAYISESHQGASDWVGFVHFYNQ